MILISNLILSVEDGSTIASTEIYGADKKTYINIGSGNVFKLSWTTPTLTNDTVDRYSLVIKRHDTTLNVYYDILNKNVGLVNEFYVDASLLPAIPLQYMLSIYLVAYNKSGSIVTSNVVNPYISKGSGTYVKVEDRERYKQPIMKRAIALAKTVLAGTLADSEGRILEDIEDKTLFAADASTVNTEAILTDLEGKTLMDIEDKALLVIGTSTVSTGTTLTDSTNRVLKDIEGNTLFAEATRILESPDGWTVMQESYTKDANTDEWRVNDIKYEVLVDQDGAIIVDSANEPIYIL